MTEQRPIWLIGMMGAGKTTVAPLVADRLGREWRDSDDEVELFTGATVAQLFAISEQEFRRAELAAIRRLADSGHVVATGGGAATTDAGRVMHESGCVVWLSADVDTLVARIGSETNRPLLTGGDPRERLREIAARRSEDYRTIAHGMIDTTDLGPDDVADQVVEVWQRWQA